MKILLLVTDRKRECLLDYAGDEGEGKKGVGGFTFSTYSYVPTRLPLLMTRMEPTVLSGPVEEVRLA